MGTDAQLTDVLDDEVLFRSIPDEVALFGCDSTGQLSRLSSSAFNDRQREPSVDRAALQSEAPSQSRKQPACGVVSLGAREVRDIRSVLTFTEKGQIQTRHAVDVVHAPEPDNFAHALVVTAPTIASDGAFKRLKEALARIAQARGWAFLPQSHRK
jgi:hypothetical protein